MFDKIALIGIGLIGGSIALAARRGGLATKIVAATRSEETAATANRLKLVDHCGTDLAAACEDADLVIVCTPVGACGEAARTIAPKLKPGCIVSDVGSVKQAVVDAMKPHLPAGVHFVPAHPVAGTENSGPRGRLRRAVRRPLDHPDAAARQRCRRGRQAGSVLEGAGQPDRAARSRPITTASSPSPRICRISSPTPSSARPTTSAGHLNSEVLRFAAGGFRDFTRIAASDPTMWRDVFLNNREAVLEMLARFQEDLFYLQRAIRWGEGDKLFELFTRTREIRRALIHLNQA